MLTHSSCNDLLPVIVRHLTSDLSDLISLSLTCKKLHEVVKQITTFHHDIEETALLPEEHGRELSGLIDLGMYATLDLALYQFPGIDASHPVTLQTVEKIRSVSTQQGFKHQQFLLARMYTNLKDRIVPYFQNRIEDEQERQSTCQELWRWSEQKRYGNYYVLLERQDGTILISEDMQHVYLVLGFRESIAKLVSKIGVPLPIQATCSLLPFKHYISYDRLLVPRLDDSKPSSKVTIKKKLMKIYKNALEKGTVISSLPHGESREFPALKDLKPSLFGFSNKTQERKKAVPTAHQSRLLAQLSKFKKSPERPQNNWVMRRFGYSPAENPNKIIVGIDSSSQIVGMYHMAKFEPQVDEILQHVKSGAESRRKRLPFSVGIDYLPIVETCQDLLETIGVKAYYYPPASQEEMDCSMPPDHPSNVQVIANGAQVRLVGLVKAAAFNDLNGIVRDYNDEKDRYAVEISEGQGSFSGKTVMVKLDNLMPNI
eukprot:TRINITY_DN6971_c0_g1_i1.p1 TRINITY_DN6971_c0_g1~~TRINITY_DN6971_c0_g1_i1.p1  ORF type:complete len:486 (+),score=124.02 TRINITY_DN6971_c0_g1_i1:125-1582(+)